MNDLENKFQHAASNNAKYIGVLIRVPDADQPEVIINKNDNFEIKLDYYQKTYDEDLYHKAVGDILQIIDVAYGNSFAEIERNLFEGGENE